MREPVYDIVNAGPRHRFTIRTNQGPIIVHNCILGLGYGVGEAKLQHTLANGFIKVHLPLEECRRIVKLYRSTYSAIQRLWRTCNEAIDAMFYCHNSSIGVGVRLPVIGEEKKILLPNGFALNYPKMEQTAGKYGPEYTYQKRKTIRAKLYGGAATENVVQSLARIVVAYQMCAIGHALDKKCKERKDGKTRQIVSMVHDEVVVIVPKEEAEETAKLMEKCMKTPLVWCKDLPVSCESGIGDSYGDAK